MEEEKEILEEEKEETTTPPDMLQVEQGSDLKRRLDEYAALPKEERDESSKGIMSKTVEAVTSLFTDVPEEQTREYDISDFYSPETGLYDANRIKRSKLPRALRAELDEYTQAKKTGLPVAHFEQWRAARMVPEEDDSGIVKASKNVLSTVSEVFGNLPIYAAQKVAKLAGNDFVSTDFVPDEWMEGVRAKLGDQLNTATQVTEPTPMEMDGLEFEVLPGFSERDVARSALQAYLKQAYDSYTELSRSAAIENAGLGLGLATLPLSGISRGAGALAQAGKISPKIATAAKAGESVGTILSPVSAGAESILASKTMGKALPSVVNFTTKNPVLTRIALQSVENATLMEPQQSTDIADEMTNRAVAAAFTVPFAGAMEVPGALIGKAYRNRLAKANQDALAIHKGGGTEVALQDETIDPMVRQSLATFQAGEAVVAKVAPDGAPLDARAIQEAFRQVEVDKDLQTTMDVMNLLSSGGTQTTEGKRNTQALLHAFDPNLRTDPDGIVKLTADSPTMQQLARYSEVINDTNALLKSVEGTHFEVALRNELAALPMVDYRKQELARALRQHMIGGDVEDAGLRDVASAIQTAYSGYRILRDRVPGSNAVINKATANTTKYTAKKNTNYELAMRTVDRIIKSEPAAVQYTAPLVEAFNTAIDARTKVNPNAARAAISYIGKIDPTAARTLRRVTEQFNRSQSRIEESFSIIGNEHVKSVVVDSLGYIHRPIREGRSKSENIIDAFTWDKTTAELSPDQAIYDLLNPVISKYPYRTQVEFITVSKEIGDQLSRGEPVAPKSIETLVSLTGGRYPAANAIRTELGVLREAAKVEDAAGMIQSASNLQKLLATEPDFAWFTTRLTELTQAAKDGKLTKSAALAVVREGATVHRAMGSSDMTIMRDLVKGLNNYSAERTEVLAIQETINKMYQDRNYTSAPMLIAHLNNLIRSGEFEVNKKDAAIELTRLAPIFLHEANRIGIDQKTALDMLAHLTSSSRNIVQLTANSSSVATTPTEIQNVFEAHKQLGKVVLDKLDAHYREVFDKPLDREVFLAQFVTPSNGWDEAGMFEHLLIDAARLKSAEAGVRGRKERLGSFASLLTTEAWESGFTRNTTIAATITMDAHSNSRRTGLWNVQEFIKENIVDQPLVMKKLRGVWAEKNFGMAANKLDGAYGFIDYYDAKTYAGEYIPQPLLLAHMDLFHKNNKRTLQQLSAGGKGREAFLAAARESLATHMPDAEPMKVETYAQHLYDYWGEFNKQDTNFWSEVYAFREWFKDMELKSHKKMEELIATGNTNWVQPGEVAFEPPRWREQRVFDKTPETYDLDDFSNTKMIFKADKSDNYRTSDSAQINKANANRKLAHPLQSLIQQVRGELLGAASVHTRSKLENWGFLLDATGYQRAKQHVFNHLAGVKQGGTWAAELERVIYRSGRVATNLYIAIKNVADVFLGMGQVFQGLSRLRSLFKNAGQAHFLAQGTRADVGVIKSIAAYVPSMIRVFKGVFQNFDSLPVTGPGRQSTVNSVLRGFRDVSNMNQLNHMMAYITAANAGTGLVQPTQAARIVNNAVLGFRDFTQKHLKERMESSISKMILEQGSDVFDAISKLVRNEGREVGFKHLQKVMGLRSKPEIWEIINQIHAATDDVSLERAARAFLLSFHADNVGRFGRDSNPLMVAQVQQILPGAARFFSAVTMPIYRTGVLGAAATQQVQSGFRAFVNAQPNGKIDAANATTYALIGKLALMAITAKVVQDGIYSTWEDKVMEDKETNRLLKILSAGIGATYGKNIMELIPIPFMQESFRGLQTGGMSSADFWYTVAHPDIGRVIRNIDKLREAFPYTTPVLDQLDALRLEIQNEPDATKRQMLIDRAQVIQATYDTFKWTKFFDVMTQTNMFYPASFLFDIGKNPVTLGKVLVDDLYESIVNQLAYGGEGVSQIAFTMYAVGLTDYPHTNSAAAMEEVIATIYRYVGLPEEEARINAAKTRDVVFEGLSHIETYFSLESALTGLNPAQQKQREVLRKMAGEYDEDDPDYEVSKIPEEIRKDVALQKIIEDLQRQKKQQPKPIKRKP